MDQAFPPPLPQLLLTDVCLLKNGKTGRTDVKVEILSYVDLTLFYPGSGKTLLPRGGHYGPHRFSALGLPKAQN